MKIQSAEFLKSVYPRDDYPPGRYPEVAFAGRSNVGKSSLINTLVQSKGLARTSSSPGKTQSINFYLVNGSLCLVDLPGYGYAKVPQQVRKRWSPLIEDYCRTRKNLRGVVVIIDARIGPTPLDLSLIQWLRDLSMPALITMTKIDKLSKNKMAQVLRQAAEVLSIDPEQISPFSAHTGAGKKELWQGIVQLLNVRHDTKRVHIIGPSPP
jgi:GTP-binding protein